MNFFKLVMTLFLIFCMQAIADTKSFVDEHLAQNTSIQLSEREKAYIKNKKIVYVSNEMDYEPLDFAVEGFPQGFSVELIQLLLKDSGLKVEFITDQWDTLIDDLNTRKIDLVSTIYKTSNREEIYTFSIGFLHETYHYVIRRDQKDIEDISELFGKKVAITKGWTEEEYINLYPQIQKVYFNNLQEKLEALQGGKVDAVINGKSVANYYISKYGFINLKISNPLKNSDIIGKNTFHFAALKDQSELISIINKRFKALSLKELEHLQEKWFGSLSKYQLFFDQEERKYLRSKVFNICVQNDLYPYIGVQQDKIVGVLADLLNPVLYQYQVKYNLVNINSKQELLEKVEQNQCELVLPFTYDDQNVLKYFDTTLPFITDHFMSIGNLQSVYFDPNINFNEHLFYVNHESIKNTLLSAYPNMRIIVENDQAKIMRQLGVSPYNHFISPKMIAENVIQNFGFDKFKYNGILEQAHWPLSLGISKNDEVLQNIINKLQRDTNPSYIQQLINQYSIKKFVVRTDYTYFFYLLAVFILITFALLNRYYVLQRKNMEIQNEKNKFQYLLQNSTDGIHIADLDGNIVECSKSFTQALGYSYDEMLRLNVRDFDHHIEIDRKLLENIYKEGGFFTTKHIRKDGTQYDAEIFAKGIIIDGEMYIYASSRDISEHIKLTKELAHLNASLEQKVKEKTKELKLANETLYESEQKLRLALNANFFGYWEFDLQNNRVYFSDAGYKILGYEGSNDFDTDTLTWDQRVHPDEREEMNEKFSALLKGDIKHYHVEHRAQNKAKEYIWLDVYAVVSKRDQDGNAQQTIGIFRDITVQKELEKQLKNINLHLQEEVEQRTNQLEQKFLMDDLTGLGSYYALLKELEKSKTETITAVVVNIDHFQDINGVYGYTIGDKVLQDFAVLLKNFNKENSFKLYRAYADEFVLLATKQYSTEQTCRENIKDLELAIEQYRCTLDDLDQEIQIDVTMGISVAQSRPLVTADMALIYAKRHKLKVEQYHPELDLTSKYQKMLDLKKELKNALDEERIVPVYHPIVDKQNNIVEYEILMRMKVVEEGKEKLLAPAHFLQTAIDLKLYTEFAIATFQKAFTEILNSDKHFSINISFEDIFNKKLIDFIEKSIENEPLIANKLIIEILETDAIEDVTLMDHFLEKFRSYGVKIAIDDFGMGHSNLSNILYIQPDILKIDGIFVKNIDTDKQSQALVKSVVTLAHELGIVVIAEFVHSQAVYEVLYDLGVEQYQGYYFSEPLTQI